MTAAKSATAETVTLRSPYGSTVTVSSSVAHVYAAQGYQAVSKASPKKRSGEQATSK